MTTMKAVRIHSQGGPEVLQYEEAPRPDIADNEVLIRVHAAAVNPLDLETARGLFHRLATHFPRNLGL